MYAQIIPDSIAMSLRTGALSLLRTSRLVPSLQTQAGLARSALVFSDIQVRDKLKEAKSQPVGVGQPGDKALTGFIEVEGAPDVTVSSGMPEEERVTRLVRIYKPAKNAMQSGTAGIKR